MKRKKSRTCSKLTIKRPERRHGAFIFNFIADVTYSCVFIVNFEHISRNMPKYGKKSNKFNRLQIEVLFLPNRSPPRLPE